jgi:hypothetical protein
MPPLKLPQVKLNGDNDVLLLGKNARLFFG